MTGQVATSQLASTGMVTVAGTDTLPSVSVRSNVKLLCPENPASGV